MIDASINLGFTLLDNLQSHTGYK